MRVRSIAQGDRYGSESTCHGSKTSVDAGRPIFELIEGNRIPTRRESSSTSDIKSFGPRLSLDKIIV
jgi:hypothetical protein